MVRYTEEEVIRMILTAYEGKRIFILAPLVRNRKGHYRELFESMLKKGYLYVHVDGQVMEIKSGMKLDRYKTTTLKWLWTSYRQGKKTRNGCARAYRQQ